jgi:uncharacterized membrane protein YozB (DUF420 family)
METEQYMGLFNPNAVFLADVNLLFQLSILVVLIGSVYFKLRRSYSKHGATMAIAVTLHTVSIFSIMLPSLTAIIGMLGTFPFSTASAVLIHAVLGSLVELFGIYLVATWVLHHDDVKVCFKNRRIMKPTIVLWLIELALGMYVYILLYVPI